MEDDIIALLVNFNLAHPNCCHPLFASASASYTIGDDNCSNETFTFITQYMIVATTTTIGGRNAGQSKNQLLN